MRAEPIIVQVANTIQEKLQRVTSGTDYYHNLSQGSVERFLIDTQSDQYPMPHVSILIRTFVNGSEVTRGAVQNKVTTWELNLDFAWESATPEERETDGVRLIQDVDKVVMSLDTSYGGSPIGGAKVSFRSNRGNLYLAELDGVIGQADHFYNVSFQHKQGDMSASV